MSSLSNRTSQKSTSILNYTCAILAFALIVTQFIPFWGCYQCKTCGDGRIISINEYVWLANDHKMGLTSILQTYYIPDFTAFDVVGTSVLLQVAAIATIILALTRPQKLTATFLALIAGLICAFGYLLHPAFQMGQLWQLHIGVGIALIAVSASNLVIAFARAYRKAKEALASEASQ